MNCEETLFVPYLNPTICRVIFLITKHQRTCSRRNPQNQFPRRATYVLIKLLMIEPTNFLDLNSSRLSNLISFWNFQQLSQEL